MTTEEKILHQAALIRGQFINHISFIEKQMEIFIGKHFCKTDDLMAELIEVLLGDRFVSFESKRGTFENIIKRHRPETYKSDKSKFEGLTTIQVQRNRFAHLIVYTGKEAEERFLKDGAIGFVKFEYEKTKPIWYSNDELQRISKAVNIIKNWLPTIINNETPS